MKNKINEESKKSSITVKVSTRNKLIDMKYANNYKTIDKLLNDLIENSSNKKVVKKEVKQNDI